MHRLSHACAGIFLAAIACAGPATASNDELTRTVAASPSLAAAARRVTAAHARIESAGRVPDVEVEGMGSRMNGPMDESSTMWELNVRQPLPRYGETAADRGRAAAAAAMAEAEYGIMAGELAADTAMAAAESEGAERRANLLEAQVARLEAVLTSVDARLAAGGGRLADRLTVQTRIAAMQVMVADSRRMAADARSESAGRLGLFAGPALPAYAAPDAAGIIPAETPAARLAAARAAEADAMGEMARASARPMTAVGLRLEREQTRMGNEDTVGLAFMTEIPWRSRRYARADARAAVAEAAAAQADGESVHHRVSAALSRVERAERQSEFARRLGAETRARLDAEFEALVRASAASGAMAGDSTVLMAVEILEKATETELQVIDAETEARVARAALWNHAPIALWLSTLTHEPQAETP